MNGLVDPKTIWLLLTNLMLGLAVVVCGAMIAWCLMRDVQRRRREKKDELLAPLDYLNGLENLGVTLPDGGETVDEMAEQ
ncbi:MAG: hypothetical protein ABSE41_17530 [Bacteroidota bacterium]|jgi:Flp pilus assembly protein TadB